MPSELGVVAPNGSMNQKHPKESGNLSVHCNGEVAVSMDPTMGGSSKWKFPRVLETIILILEELEEDAAHIFLHLFPSIPFVVQHFCRRKAEARACIYKVIGR